ncbi:MAG: carbohydrate binding domain-containing protein, partial [Acidobacteria bacterium]|nr:carbohydrate binding domain-containing protein [Acidobacteriota bacterium]
GSVTNGSFEQVLESGDEPNFGWRRGKPDPKIEVSSDNRVSHEGTRSLRLTFRGTKQPTFLDPLQTVVVESGKKYRLRFWARTENLRSGGNPLITVQNGVDDGVLVQSAAVAQGTNDWQEFSVDISVPKNCDGIVISVGRAFCGEDCPISGIVWFDDLRLEKL